MHVSLVGGIERLQKHYLQEAKKLGVDLRIFNKKESNLGDKIGCAEAVVIFTGKISHTARIQAMGAAQGRNIPVVMTHNCGVCALRDCLNCIRKGTAGH